MQEEKVHNSHCLFTQYVADDIWTRAQVLQNRRNIVDAPGIHRANLQAWMVASSRGQKPHYVQHRKGRYLCDKEGIQYECIQYECMKACSHIVAVALKNRRLDEYLAWHLRNNPMPNMTTLAESGLPKASIGKKLAKNREYLEK